MHALKKKLFLTSGIANEKNLRLIRACKAQKIPFASVDLLLRLSSRPPITVFVGLYETFGRRQILEDERLPVLDTPLNQSDYVHDLRLQTDVMRDYVGRLVIEPWKDAINFVQRASGRDPRILEIKRVRQDEPFLGLLSFSRRISELAGIFRRGASVLLRQKAYTYLPLMMAINTWVPRQALRDSGRDGMSMCRMGLAGIRY
jgi:hypothetical protein